MLDKKKTFSLLLLGASAATAVLATNIYFSSRSVLKHIKINNKNDVNQITPEEFKEKWENEGLNFNSPIFKQYFDFEFKHSKANNVLKNLTFDKLESNNNDGILKFKLIYKKGYGKDEIREITLSNFRAESKFLIDKELNSLKFDLSDDVKNNAVNTLASEVNKNISSFKIESDNKGFNKDNYSFDVKTNPNDITGKLYAQITVTSKTNNSISKVFTLDNLATQFKVYESKEEIKNASINYAVAKNEIKEKRLYTGQLIVEYLQKYPAYALTNLITYDDSNMTIKPSFKREHFSSDGNNVTLEYWILTPKNNPSKFNDNGTLENIITRKQIKIDFSYILNESINEVLQEKMNVFDFDFDGTAEDKKYMQASKIKKENIKSTVNSDDVLDIEYLFTHPNDEIGEVTVVGIIKHKVSGKTLTKTKKNEGFSKESKRLEDVISRFIFRLQLRDDLSSPFYFDEIEKEYNETCKPWWDSHYSTSSDIHKEAENGPIWTFFKKYFKNIDSLFEVMNPTRYSHDGIRYIPIGIRHTTFNCYDIEDEPNRDPNNTYKSLTDITIRFYASSQTIIDKNEDGTYVYKNIEYTSNVPEGARQKERYNNFDTIIKLQQNNFKNVIPLISQDIKNKIMQFANEINYTNLKWYEFDGKVSDYVEKNSLADKRLKEYFRISLKTNYDYVYSGKISYELSLKTKTLVSYHSRTWYFPPSYEGKNYPSIHVDYNVGGDPISLTFENLKI